MSYGSLYQEQSESLVHRMVTFKEFTISGDSRGLLTSEKGYNYNDLVGFWLIQDIMSCQLLLQILFHAFTLLERGQSYSKFPGFSAHKCFYLILLLLVCVHTLIVYIRDAMRCNSNIINNSNISTDASSSYLSYSDFTWPVWVVLVCLPLLSVLVGLFLNEQDARFYRRHLQFLRLEFDTRLGMHSPR